MGYLIRHILTLFLILYTVSIKGQDRILNSPFSIEIEQASLETILLKISNQCKCYFSYSSDIIENNKFYNLKENNTPLRVVLSKLFDQGTIFTEYKNQIIIRKGDLQNGSQSPAVSKRKQKRICGTVVNKTTREPLPYATIYSKSNHFGTITNKEGYFSLALPDDLLEDTLQVSFVGFESNFLTISTATDALIQLTPTSVSIQEIIVRNIQPSVVIARVQEHLKKNDQRESYGYEAFYRETFIKKGRCIVYTESIFDGVVSKRTQNKSNQHYLKMARKFSSISSKDTLLIKLQGGLETCFLLDVMQNTPEFLDKDCFSNYLFRIEDITYLNNRMVYVVTFEPKSGKKGRYEGQMYVDLENYALWEINFNVTKQTLKENRTSFIIKKAKGSKAYPTSYKYRIQYQKRNNCLALFHVHGKLQFKGKSKHQMFYSEYKTYFEMIVTHFYNATPPEKCKNNRIKRNTVLSDHLPFNYVEMVEDGVSILPEQEIVDAFNKSGFKMNLTEN